MDIDIPYTINLEDNDELEIPNPVCRKWYSERYRKIIYNEVHELRQFSANGKRNTQVFLPGQESEEEEVDRSQPYIPIASFLDFDKLNKKASLIKREGRSKTIVWYKKRAKSHRVPVKIK